MPVNRIFLVIYDLALFLFIRKSTSEKRGATSCIPFRLLRKIYECVSTKMTPYLSFGLRSANLNSKCKEHTLLGKKFINYNE